MKERLAVFQQPGATATPSKAARRPRDHRANFWSLNSKLLSVFSALFVCLMEFQLLFVLLCKSEAQLVSVGTNPGKVVREEGTEDPSRSRLVTLASPFALAGRGMHRQHQHQRVVERVIVPVPASDERPYDSMCDYVEFHRLHPLKHLRLLHVGSAATRLQPQMRCVEPPLAPPALNTRRVCVVDKQGVLCCAVPDRASQVA